MGGSVTVKSKLNVGSQFIVNMKSKSSFLGRVDISNGESLDKYLFIHKAKDSNKIDTLFENLFGSYSSLSSCKSNKFLDLNPNIPPRIYQSNRESVKIKSSGESMEQIDYHQKP